MAAEPIQKPEPHDPSPLSSPDPSRIDMLVSVMTVFGHAVSARLILLLTLAGAFVLAVMAMQNQTMWSLAVLIAYAVLAVLPTVALEVLGHRK